MANKPVFVGGYRQDVLSIRPLNYTESWPVITPGANGTRIHQMAITSLDDVNDQIVEFGTELALSSVETVNITPGATPASDDFTITKTSDDWLFTGIAPGDLVTLNGNDLNAANRGIYKVKIGYNMSDSITLENTEGNTITQQLGVNIKLTRWEPLWSVTVPAGSGRKGIASVNGLDATQMPWLDLADPFLLIKNELKARLPENTGGDRGGVYITAFSGDY